MLHWGIGSCIRPSQTFGLFSLVLPSQDVANNGAPPGAVGLQHPSYLIFSHGDQGSWELQFNNIWKAPCWLPLVCTHWQQFSRIQDGDFLQSHLVMPGIKFAYVNRVLYHGDYGSSPSQCSGLYLIGRHGHVGSFCCSITQFYWRQVNQLLTLY